MELIDWLLARVPDSYALGWSTYLAASLALSLQWAWLLRRLPFPALRFLLWLLFSAVLFTPVPVVQSAAELRFLPALTTVPLAVIQSHQEDLELALRALNRSLVGVVIIWALGCASLAWYRMRSAAASSDAPQRSGGAMQWGPLSQRRKKRDSDE